MLSLLVDCYFSFNSHGLTPAIFVSSQFLMPGLVDTHIHAPQYVNSGTGYDLMLLDWLNTYTFPTEARFKQIDFASDVYVKAVVCQYV